MNTAHRLASAALVIATAGAGFLATSGPAAAETRVVVMPRVEVVGKREAAEPVRVVVMPRVEVTGRRVPTVVAQQSARGPRG